MTKLVDIEGIGETYAEKLEAIGISTIEQLLEKGAQPSGRKSIAEESEISSKLVLKWINRADLARVKGISTQYADLLEFVRISVIAIARFGLFRSPDPAVFLSSYFYAK